MFSKSIENFKTSKKGYDYSKPESTPLYYLNRCVADAKCNDHNFFISTFDEGLGKVFSFDRTEKSIKEIYSKEQKISSKILFLGEEKVLITSMEYFIIFDLKTEEEFLTQKAHQNPITFCLNLPNSFLTASSDGTIKEWNYNGYLIHSYQGHQSSVFSMERISDSTFVSASANSDKRLIFWDYVNKIQVEEIDINFSNGIFNLLKLSDSILLTTGVFGIRLLDLNKKEFTTRFPYPSYLGIATVTKNSENIFMVGANPGRVFVYDTKKPGFSESFLATNENDAIIFIQLLNKNNIITLSQNGNLMQHSFSYREPSLENIEGYLEKDSNSDITNFLP